MPTEDKPTVVIVDQQLESTLETVDASEAVVQRAAAELGFDEDCLYQLGYAVREAVVNAVVHGNHYSANKAVHFKLEGLGGGLRITVEDEGQGFAPGEQADPLADENLLNQSGRGIMIIRAFVDEFSVEPTCTGGTRVVMTKLPPAGTNPPAR
jgi:serine/threonine-protein kinase RsbW